MQFRDHVAETKVLAGLTTTLNFTLKSAAVQLEGITVTAVKPLIKRDVTQTTRIIESEDIEAMPRDTVNGISANPTWRCRAKLNRLGSCPRR